MKLWYQKEAREWTQALPIGNGYMGAMCYGGPGGRFDLSENACWSGENQPFPLREGAAESMKQGANRLDAVREELHQTGTHARNAAGVIFGKSPQEAGVLEADHGILARVRNSMESCGKSFAEMGQYANHLAEQFRLEKPSVKSQL